MSEQEFEQRLSQLEQKVFDGRSPEDLKDDIGFLKKKLRDAGEEFEETKKRVEKLQTSVERLQSEDDVLEEVKAERSKAEREFESRVEDVETILDRAEKVEDNADRIAEMIDDRLDELDEAMEDKVITFLKNSDINALYSTTGYFNSRLYISKMIDDYLPLDCESAIKLKELTNDRSNIPSDMNKSLNEALQMYFELVDYIEESDELDFDARNSEEFFKSYASVWSGKLRTDSRGEAYNYVQKHYMDAEGNTVYDNALESLGLEKDSIPEDGELKASTIPQIMKRQAVEVYGGMITDGCDIDEGCKDFFSYFEDHEMSVEEVKQMMLMASGVDSEWVENVPEDVFKSALEKYRQEADEKDGYRGF